MHTRHRPVEYGWGVGFGIEFEIEFGIELGVAFGVGFGFVSGADQIIIHSKSLHHPKTVVFGDTQTIGTTSAQGAPAAGNYETDDPNESPSGEWSVRARIHRAGVGEVQPQRWRKRSHRGCERATL